MRYISLAFLALLFATACGSSDSQPATPDEHDHAHEETPENVVVMTQEQSKKIGVELGAMQQKNLNAVLKVAGYLTASPDGRASATSLVSGIIQQILVKHGQRVQRGDALLRIQAPALLTMQKEYLATYNQLQRVENELKRQKQLMQDSATSRRSYEQTQIEYDNLLRTIQLQETELKLYNVNPTQIIAGNLQTFYTVVSPISGNVQEVTLNLGGFAEMNQPLISILNTNGLQIDFLVYEKSIDAIRVGQIVDFSYKGKAHQARIVATNKELEAKERALRVHAEVVGDAADLVIGGYVEGKLSLGNASVDCLPESAIAKQNGIDYIFVQSKTDHDDFWYEKIPVLVGTKDGDLVQVSPTLPVSQPEKIVIKGAFFIMAQSQKSGAAHEH